MKINGERKRLTNEAGERRWPSEHSLTAGPRGPGALQDVWLLEKRWRTLTGEVIPERRMHAKGWGAYGSFIVTRHFPVDPGKVRSPAQRPSCSCAFPPWRASGGAADAEQDIRGVAVKFYTEEATGTWWATTPHLLLRDVHNFPDLNRAVKRIRAPACAAPE